MKLITKYFNLIPGKVYELYSVNNLLLDSYVCFYSEGHEIRIQYKDLNVKKFIFLTEEDPMKNKVGYPIKVFIDGKVLYIGHQFPLEQSNLKFKEVL